ncbi:2Fe-2S iron-sulfur cluster binding domain-containing protein [Donghicola sp. C2-DW-16]|uniref:2Fe-2S iron-sulfur cluster binding domain-containing protein n=1 Tax=Donghicola mangrovi TaxID=2729614 RepID=A0A850QDD7_9RHOB|nr:2Fe-2S iron-sulfur cluster-binding protein [Donghicola mangrovi]NVO24948.1 2Fe-2S iron-sulfur cluster binding domain-containing protein [Donghicola mangrovi]NVO28091.1 2Fe-2S iron-sulfur cluster binding domain-containing protein [Donghicola mangrovi]
MVAITFIQPDGASQTVTATVGDSVMQTALNNNIDGIFAECGGAMMCATCHCYVDDAWTDATGERVDGEEDMLDCAEAEMRPTSRLTCQIKVTDALDGLVVHLPEA